MKEDDLGLVERLVAGGERVTSRDDVGQVGGGTSVTNCIFIPEPGALGDGQGQQVWGQAPLLPAGPGPSPTQTKLQGDHRHPGPRHRVTYRVSWSTLHVTLHHPCSLARGCPATPRTTTG